MTASSGELNGGGGGARLDGLPFDVHDSGEFSSWGGGAVHYFLNMGGNYSAIFLQARRDGNGFYINGNTTEASGITYTITNQHLQGTTTLSGYATYITDA